MNRFRHLMVIALLAGSMAGLLLFAVRHVTIIPLITIAEGFEEAAAHAGHDHAPGAHAHEEDEGWQPAPGFQRISLTAATTVLSGIGFAAMLLAAMSLSGAPLTARRGVLWGLAGFACFVLAPALGLPPRPPGAVEGDLHARQLWWAGTVVATAAGLWLIAARAQSWWSPWWNWVAGLILVLLPHAVGAPMPHGMPDGADVVPPMLIRDFVRMSLATNLLFWIVLGVVCGALMDRAAQGRRAVRRV